MRRQRLFAVKADVNPILDISRKAYCEVVDDMNGTVLKNIKILKHWQIYFYCF